ncbi:hypothetical protein N431DRAFT_482267 [Stipitochalara longipes BDJ]|nr:hypothetical protein N431DRAFT_482267 [Stipitochalara longipes BDJ]
MSSNNPHVVPYIYEPLSKHPDEMRLLTLMPLSSSDGLEIEISHVPFSSLPAYEALSYVWGSPDRIHRVAVKTSSGTVHEYTGRSISPEIDLPVPLIQPTYLSISQNLLVALKYLRLPEEPRLLWIDAICINQDNVPERGEQVKKMGSIYSKARRVILWLGEAADESTLAFATLKSLGEGLDVYRSDNAISIETHPDGLAEVLESDLTVVTGMLPSWRAIKKLLERRCIHAIQVDYTDKDILVKLLHGVNTVLSFIIDPSDTSSLAQKTLIDASNEAGVKRFAPNEWATRSNSGIAWYAGKDDVHEYLRQVNKEKKVLEYTLFQPGLFLNYLSYPHKSTEYLNVFQIQIDLDKGRAIVLDEAAIDYEGEWPEVGGLRGGQIKISDLIKQSEEVRGKPFAVDRLPKADIEAGELKTTWIPDFSRPKRSLEDIALVPATAGLSADTLSRMVITGSLLAIARGAWDVSDEWNQLLPQLKLTGIEEFLRKIWEGKP